MLLTLLSMLAVAAPDETFLSDVATASRSFTVFCSDSTIEATASVTLEPALLTSRVNLEDLRVVIEGSYGLCTLTINDLEVRLNGDLLLKDNPGLSDSGGSGAWELSATYDLADEVDLLLRSGTPITVTARGRANARGGAGTIRVTLSTTALSGRDWDGDGYASDLLPDCDEGCDPEIADLHDGDCPCDCDDDDPDVNPGADEVCDGIDNNCDTFVDVGAIDALTWFTDGDGDGYGDDFATVEACAAPSGTVGRGGDCDDTDPYAFPTAGFNELDGGDLLCMRDFDGDGFGDPREDQPFEPGTDCDDTDPDVYPGAPEIPGDGIDQSCDGLEACFQDLDGDGWRTDETTPSADLSCTDEGLAAAVIPALDCDDTDPRTFPGVATAEAPDLRVLCLRDRDADGWGDATEGGPFVPGNDCDDTQPTAFPGAREVCDCLSLTLPEIEADLDLDLYVVCEPEVDVWLGPTPIRGGLDCDDRDAATFPGAAFNEPEIGSLLCMRDVDGDGWGDDSALAPIEAGTDCDDLDPAINPGATEIWYDGVDQDCDGHSDYDQDFDGFDAWFFPRDDGTRGEDCDDEDPSVVPGSRGFTPECERIVEQDGSRSLPDRADPIPATGCACATSSPGPAMPWLLGLGIAGLLSRRRRDQPRRRPHT